MEGCMWFKDEYTGVHLFGFWVHCILLFKYLLSFGLSEHKQNCKIVERCLSRTIRSYALLETKPANEVWMHSETKRLTCLRVRLALTVMLGLKQAGTWMPHTLSSVYPENCNWYSVDRHTTGCIQHFQICTVYSIDVSDTLFSKPTLRNELDSVIK